MKTIQPHPALWSRIKRWSRFCLAACLLSPLGACADDAAADSKKPADSPKPAAAAPAEPAAADTTKAPAATPETKPADATEAKPAAAETKKESAEAEKSAETTDEGVPQFNNWMEFSTGGVISDGNGAAFRQRHWIKDDPFGGLEDMHYETKVGKKDFFQIDGRALFDNHDYNVRMELVRPEVGFVRGGFTQYRTWYDGNGGFFPQTGTWMNLFDDALHVDRGEAWIETGLNLPKYPSITLKYSHQFREGQKDSTAWGYAHPYGAGPVRGIAPSFWDLDETRDTVQIDSKYTIKKTDLGIGLRYERTDDNNALKSVQWPGESSQTFMTQKEGVKSDLFNVHAFTETRLNEKVRFSSGYSFTTMDTDLSGSRVYGADYDVGYSMPLATSLGYLALTGGSQLNDYLMNLNLMWNPVKSFSIVPSLRVEKQELDSMSSFLQTGGGSIMSDQQMGAASARNLLEVAERLEMKYTGVTNWVFYARGDWTEGDGDLRENGGGGLSGPILRFTKDERFIQRYTAGANWYPLRRLNVDFQYYHKMRDNNFDHQIDNTPNDSTERYPAYLLIQNFETDDANMRVTVRPLNNVTLVSRYDFQLSSINTTPDSISGLGDVQSSEVESHILGQNITWVPWKRLFWQGGINYVWSKTSTPTSQYTQAVLDSQNNYWDVSSTAGFIIDDKTDLQAHYFFYRANNYEGPSAYIPYGAGARENGVTLTLTRKLRENLRITCKYGYFDYTDETSGGHNDYAAHLIYSSLQYRF